MLLLNFYVPHGHCYLWQTNLVSLHVISDLLIALAYYSIPLLLVYFIRQRKETPFQGILLLFSTFILACGTTHLMEVWTVWHPDYWLSGLVKAFTALVSVYTAIVLIKLIPSALSLPSWSELEQEIREREEVEAKLKESQYLIKQITDTTPTILYIYDLEEKRNIYSNSAIGDVLGYSPQEIKEMGDKLLAKVIHPDDLSKLNQHHQNLASPKKDDSLEVEYRTIHRSGEWRWLYSRDTTFAFNDHGEVKQILGSCIDITERKQVEIRLQQYQEHLEELVSTRTAELQAEITERRQAEENLRQSNNNLARSNQELEQFAYIASHDLQEPLRAVASYAQLLDKRYKDKLDERAEKYIVNIVDGGTRMQQLVNDLLNYSRVGTKGASFQPVATENIVQEVLSNLKVAIAETKAKITYDTLPTITGDKTQLVQLFQNLISNALKFRGNKPPDIHVFATKESQAWHFCIRDHGIGIESQYAERIFLIFQRLHSRSKYPGTGIGLAICKKIVERHKGKIWLDSKLGEGSAFYFSFPFLKQDM
ncbi:MAG: ATP-binding protein [Spirulinaceae cyanobacterium]